jgi:hypothetical protein
VVIQGIYFGDFVEDDDGFGHNISANLQESLLYARYPITKAVNAYKKLMRISPGLAVPVKKRLLQLIMIGATGLNFKRG